VKTPRPHFLYPSVVPDLPEPATYLPLLQEMHERHWYSNFGPLVRQFEHLLLASFGRPGETCVTACNATAAQGRFCSPPSHFRPRWVLSAQRG
jgi:hypothetical protein